MQRCGCKGLPPSPHAPAEDITRTQLSRPCRLARVGGVEWARMLGTRSTAHPPTGSGWAAPLVLGRRGGAGSKPAACDIEHGGLLTNGQTVIEAARENAAESPTA